MAFKIKTNKKLAIEFIILLGMVSLFTDIVSDGARSIIGPYLGLLGASAAMIGFISGLGELISYGLRIISGYIIEITGSYWIVASFGYITTLVVVPLFALAGHWEFAAILLVIERMGKSLRTPARDTMLAHASQQLGRGWGFGIHKFFDQIGAMIGPILVTVVLYLRQSYQEGFLWLIVPGSLVLVVLFIASRRYPHPKELEEKQEVTQEPKEITLKYWLYVCGAMLVAAGFADFPLIAYHFQKIAIFQPIWIPMLYALALGVSGITAAIFGTLFDHNGYYILILVVVLSALFAPLVFLGGAHAAIIGMALWGLGMGSQVSIMRAIIANLIPMKKRASAFGIFNAGYGVFWFLGSTFMGALYSISIVSLVTFSVIIQLSAIPLFLTVKWRKNHATTRNRKQN